MTAEQINRKLAEWCGWKLSVPLFDHDGKWSRIAYSGGKDIWIGFSTWAGEPHDVIDDWSHIPNYYASLDAVHKVEMRLLDPDFTYEKMLHEITLGRGERATAPQRCEALLKILNLWEEAP